MDAQFGSLLYGDLKENNMTIEMDESVVLRGGNYAVIRIDNITDKLKLEELLKEEALNAVNITQKSKKEKEFILCAALNFNGNIISAHRHSDCYALLKQLLPNLLDKDLPQRENQGFLTSLNRYVDRKEGWVIAKENNQIQWGLEASENGESSQLISENLY